MPGSVLVAIGGNSLIRAGEQGTIPQQIENARRASRTIVRLLSEGYRLVITHGNGPQVGAALLRSERAAGQAYEHGLNVCVAATQGEIGYILQQSLQQEIQRTGLSVPVTTVLTQVVVALGDAAFSKPTKPIGPFYSRAAAEEKQKLYGWSMVEDASRGYRRIVASPEPLEIIEEPVIRRLLDLGIVVIAMGGGGIPVVRADGGLRGVDAVIDKDRASSLLAVKLQVDRLAFSTDADCVYLNFRRPNQQALGRVGAREIKAHLAGGQFPPGNMGPKIESALRFLDGGGREVIITSQDHLYEAIQGRAGTCITARPA